MSIFVDTSALFAVLDADDQNHARAKETWSRLLADEEELLSTNYVIVETFALVQRRLGMAAVQTLHEDIVPVLKMVWVNAAQHSAATGKLIAASKRQTSLVDWVSFDTMRRFQIKTAFAFDSDFRTEGFDCIPPETDLSEPEMRRKAKG
jgi:predicted nucleic acid-binding protein